MNIKLMEYICCPICKKDLELQILTNKIEDNNIIINGNLNCKKCNMVYPIIDEIPCLVVL